MTLTEARAFIKRAERQPLDKVDVDQLTEAAQVLMGVLTVSDPATADYAARTRALLTKVMDRRGHVADTRGIVPEIARVDRGYARALPTGVSAQGKGGLSAALERRLRDLASTPGIEDRLIEITGYSTIDEMIESAVQAAADAAAAGLPPPNLDEMLRPVLADLESAAAQLAPSPIGVPDDFEAVTGTAPPGAMRFGEADPRSSGRIQKVKPRYFEGDQLTPAGQDPAAIGRIQARLVEAGLLDPDGYWAGFWDSATSDAYLGVLGYANQRGSSADQALSDLIASVPDSVKEARNRAKLAKVFVADPFVEPDKATLAQDVKAMFRQKVGRDPRPDELAEMSSALGSDYRAAYDAQVAAERSLFEAEQQAAETGVPQTAQAFSSVDPSARFAQLFDERYGPEMDFIDDQETVARNTQNIMGNLTRITQMLGG